MDVYNPDFSVLFNTSEKCSQPLKDALLLLHGIVDRMSLELSIVLA